MTDERSQESPGQHGLSDAKQRLLDRWLAGAARPEGIGSHDGDAPVAATAAQRRMWVHARLLPGTAAYNIGQAVRLTGPLDVVALRRALAELVARHEALRTTLSARDDDAVTQVVAPALELPLRRDDSGGDRSAEAGWIAALDTEPFDLERGPLVRFGLLRHADGEHVLMLVVHHAVADGLSLGVLLRELFALYEAFTSGLPSPLPPPQVTYRDYARWREKREAGPEYAAHLAAWREKLGGEPPRLDLPTDRPRPPVAGSLGVSHRFTLDPRVWSAVRELARRHDATPYMAAVAALTALLHRYTGQQAVPVGSVVHGRERPELQQAVGCFADTVVLRTAVEPDTPFGELLDRVRGTCHEAYARQEVSLDAIATELRWDRSTGAGPLPQVLAVMQSPPQGAEVAGLRAEPVEQEVDSARFDLVLNCWETGGTLHGAVTGNADLYDRESVARTAGHLVRLLADVAERGEHTTAGGLEVVPDAERELLLRWGRPVEGDDPLVDRDLAALVREAALRDPGAVAVECGDRSLTYGELEARAAGLAARLRASGVGPETLVGVLLERSVDLVVALLGVLKSQGAFVPLEVSWPSARVQDLADRCGLSLVVGGEEADRLLAGSGVRVVRPDAGGDGADAGPEPEPAGRTDMERIAYVIHTSGSTGTPKGVMIRHQAICNRMLWQIGKLGLRPDDAVLHKAPLGFDISINEIFLPLVAGARLVVAEPGDDGDVDRLLETIEGRCVTFLYIVASMLDVLLERVDAARRLRSLRHLWCGGEALTADLYARFRQVSPARMYHGYGPAETTIGVSCRVFEPSESTRRVTIGRPNPNARLYVLDAALRPVPVGVGGELHIGGLPLARGYLGDPERTAESFIADPYADTPGARMYRTGDLARFTPGGEIEFLGRADDQVKIRGFRVEPGEVAAVLARHPAVRQAAVLARTAAGGGHELVGYCSVRTGAEGEQGAAGPASEADPAGMAGAAAEPGPADPGGEELRGWLAGLLPAHAVPRAVLVLAELPLTTAGKVDRKALGALPLPSSGAEDGWTAPAAGTQDAVARIWAELLDVDKVGAHDNFFDLGGHSLLVVRAQTLIEQRIGVKVPLLTLFSNATVARLAAYLDTGGGEGADGAEPPAEAGEQARARALRGREALSARRSRRPQGRPQVPAAGEGA
ncbi:putative non-ribosomal peptide synthetase [Actinacidiphila reveromycinica]|uniref:Putative non-ribosomal peptide synthetase n=1 Tax=Actinacidiphila reveromycinica TaxID=659352 RepID=A0A7U3VST8_9ACTN|nr:non-ribosomal peptide synthetase [Streptomyces sp. SN-593]BBB02298.1 putative non-ribosomal peptide synthetase [Streptomyces sp. SN-593]